MSDFKVGFIPRIGPREFEEKAEEILKQNDFWRKKFPTKTELLANKLGYEVDTISGLKEHSDSKGLVVFEPAIKKFYIFIDDDHYNNDSGSYEFTIAEELSHIILHSKIFEGIKNIEDRLKLNEDIGESTHRYIETQAKGLASELLLPGNIFWPYVRDWVKQNLRLIENERPLDENDFSSIISKYLRNDLGLSDIIVRRALVRDMGQLKIKDLKASFSIKYLTDSNKKANNNENEGIK